MTVDANSELYPILRMTKGTACSPSGLNQWMADPSEDIQDGFTCTVEDKTGEIPENIEVEALLQSRAVPHQIPQNTYCRMLMSDISAQMKLQG